MHKLAIQLLLFIVNLTDFTSKIWQLCSIVLLGENVFLYTNGYSAVLKHISCCIFKLKFVAIDSMLTHQLAKYTVFAYCMACLTPNWPISLQIYAGLTILGTLRFERSEEWGGGPSGG